MENSVPDVEKRITNVTYVITPKMLDVFTSPFTIIYKHAKLHTLNVWYGNIFEILKCLSYINRL